MRYIKLRKIVRKQKAEEQRRKEFDSKNSLTIYTSLKDEKWWNDFLKGNNAH